MRIGCSMHIAALKMNDVFPEDEDELFNELSIREDPHAALTLRDIDKWKEAITDEIEAAGYEPSDVLGVGTVHLYQKEPMQRSLWFLWLLKQYSASVSLGPKGHTLSAICRNTFHEYGVFHGMSSEEAGKLRENTGNAANRYLNEMMVVNKFLSDHGFAVSINDVEGETSMVYYLAAPANNAAHVNEKAVKILKEFIPRFIKGRLVRLYEVMHKLRTTETPDFLSKGRGVLLKPYQLLKNSTSGGSRQVAGQDALMTMAFMNWKPKAVPEPEYLPVQHYQTVANLRNKTLKLLTDAELVMDQHQQSIDDLEVFLIVTALFEQTERLDQF